LGCHVRRSLYVGGLKEERDERREEKPVKLKREEGLSWRSSHQSFVSTETLFCASLSSLSDRAKVHTRELWDNSSICNGGAMRVCLAPVLDAKEFDLVIREELVN
jgi:hypothetical protein